MRALIQQVAQEINDTHPPAPTTVIDWITAYRRNGESSFAPKRRPGNLTLRFDPLVEQVISEGIRDLYLKPEGFNAIDVRSHVVGRLAELGLCNAHKDAIRIPALRTIQDRISKIDPIVVARARKGQIAADRLARAAGRTSRSDRCLSIVEMDTHKLDVLIVDPDTGEVLGRPFLTLLIDVCSRAVVGMAVSLYPPSAITALAGLRNMLTRMNHGQPGGIPAVIVIDNGVEFKNTSFYRLCQALSITISFSQVREPNDKPHIERHFGTLTRGIIQKLPGTTFSSPSARGDYESEKRACFTLQQVQQYAEEWSNESYHTAIHRMTGRAPILMWQDQIQAFPPLSLSEDDVNAMARRPVLRTIQNGRVQVDYIEYFSHALATLEAQGERQVTVLIDDLNLASVFVEHPSEKNLLILAESTDPEYTHELTKYVHEEALKEKKKLSETDLHRLGKNANLLARYRLLQRIHKDSKAARSWIRKLTAGKGRIRTAHNINHLTASTEAAATVLPCESIVPPPEAIAPIHGAAPANDTSKKSKFTSYELD